MNDKEKEYMNTAIQFARMYGVGETLEPVVHIHDEEFIKMINEWTSEYLEDKFRIDMTKFFEYKFRRLKRMKRLEIYE